MRKLFSLVVVAASASAAAAHPQDGYPVRPVPVAVEIVIEGHEIAMGNDAIESDPSSTYPGMLPKLTEAFDADDLAHLLPPGSIAGVLAYADHNDIRVPMRTVTALDGRAAFGSQKDYYRRIGNSMVTGIEGGLAELAAVDADKKFLVVIGDGTDTNSEAAKAQLESLRKEAEQGGVRVVSVIYKNALSEPASPIVAFDHHATTAIDAEAAWQSVTSRITLSLANDVPEELASAMTQTKPSSCALSDSKVQLALGSSLLLLICGGLWFVRRERM